MQPVAAQRTLCRRQNAYTMGPKLGHKFGSWATNFGIVATFFVFFHELMGSEGIRLAKMPKTEPGGLAER